MATATQPKQDLRALKALVGVMGVLIILGTALVIGVVISRLYARSQAPSIFVAAPAVAHAVLAPGEHIAGIAAAGGNVAVWVTGPGGDRLLLLDPASGALRTALGPAK